MSFFDMMLVGAIPNPFISNYAYYDVLDSNITITGQGVSQINDQTSNARHLIQATDGLRPFRYAAGKRMLFNGAVQIEKTALTLNQTFTVYIVLASLDFPGAYRIPLDFSAGGTSLYQGLTNRYFGYAGVDTAAGYLPDIPKGQKVLVTLKFRGTTSSIQKNVESAVTADWGLNNGTRIRIGMAGNDTGGHKMGFYALGISAADDDAATMLAKQNYLITKHGLTTGDYESNVTYSGSTASSLVEKATQSSAVKTTEGSIAVEGSTLVGWFTNNTGSGIDRHTSSDGKTFTITHTSVLSKRFGRVYHTKIGGFYYAIQSTNWLTNSHKYMYKSTDGITWTIINGGNPVLTQTAATGIWDNIWNTDIVTTDGGTTWHLLSECGTLADQTTVGMGYSVATMSGDNISFDAQRTSVHVVPYGGNMHLIHVPERSAFMVIHGNIFDPSSIPPASSPWWYLTGSHALLSSDLKLPASWTTRRQNFTVATKDIHVTDACYINLPAGYSGKSLLVYTNNQVNMCSAFSQRTVLETYDTLVV